MERESMPGICLPTSKRFAKLVNGYEKTTIMSAPQSHSFNTMLESKITTHKFIPQWLGWLRQWGMLFPGGDGQPQWQTTITEVMF